MLCKIRQWARFKESAARFKESVGGEDLQDGGGVRRGDHRPPHKYQKYIYMWHSSYRTPTERWRKTSDFPKEQTAEGDLHAEAGPNPKQNPGSCANKEEKGKSLPAASGERIKSPQST